jgi:hypothetical protein
MAEYIQEADLAAYLRTTITGGQADLFIELANGLVTDIIGDIDPVPTQVRAITLEVAARAWRNPDGYSSVSEEIDDFTKTVRREGDALTSPGVYLTDAETDLLLGLLGTRGPQVGSIRLNVPSVHYVGATGADYCG